jgi:dTDP-4-dehydrorhamnose reductase
MLGHKVWQRWRDRADVWVTAKRTPSQHLLFDHDRVIRGVDVLVVDSVIEAVRRVQPEVVIDCVGVVKQADAAKDPIATIGINALFPHRLALLCQAVGARLVHISTDCVFSGRGGAYTETSTPDALDLYGRSKLLGELDQPGCLTIRTSMIGRELGHRTHGLVEWFLAQRGKSVPGFRHALFSGFTTEVLAEIIECIVERQPRLEGVYHVAAEPISKLDLLVMLQAAFAIDVTVQPVDEPRIDRRLDGRKFRDATGFQPPSWQDMVRRLAADPTPYDAWRGTYDF